MGEVTRIDAGDQRIGRAVRQRDGMLDRVGGLHAEYRTEDLVLHGLGVSRPTLYDLLRRFGLR